MPSDLEISGDEATLVATVTYDTKDLYGKIVAKQEFKVKKAAEKAEKKDDAKKAKKSESK